jgi:DNA-binding beta-propeller fold protein YncE
MRVIRVACSVALCLVLVAAAGPATAAATAEFNYLESFGPDGTESTGFSTAGAIAVDQSADIVYVLDRSAGSLLKFDLEGTPVPFTGAAGYISGNELTGIGTGPGPSLVGEQQVAVNQATHVIYVTGEGGNALLAFQSDGEPALFTAGPGEGTNRIAGDGLVGVAVDRNGAIYASDGKALAKEAITIYSSTGALLTTVEVQGPSSVAVDSHGTLYVSRFGLGVSKYTPSVFPVTPATTYAVAPELFDTATAVNVAVDPATNEVYVAEREPTRIAVFGANGVLRTTFGGSGEEGELAASEGVAVDSSSEHAFVSNAPESELSQVEIFKRERPVLKPTIESLAIGSVTADTATFRARINPNTLDTSYRFEYGLGDCAVSTCASVPLGGLSIGSGFDGVAVSQSVGGLQQGTVYHYRLVAENSLGASEASATFKTQSTGLGFQMSDARAWEMVSPPQKFGGDIVDLSAGLIQAAASGDGLVYATRGSIEENPDGLRSPDLATVLAKRIGTQWASKDLTPPHSRAAEPHGDTEYNIFSPDLSLAELDARDETPLSDEASEQTPYLRHNADPGSFTPLVTAKEPFANVPPGTHFGEIHSRNSENTPLRMEAANADLTHVVIRSELTPLADGAVPGSLYMWSNGNLETVSVLPEAEGGETVKAVAGSGRGSVRHAVSSDGARVFWSPTTTYNESGIGLPALYLRDTLLDLTTRLDVAEVGVSPTSPARPAFQGASAEGSVVFFSDSQQLTDDASPVGRDLYRCAIGLVGGSLGCASLTDLTAPLEGSGESAGFHDQVSALSEDGKQLYFAATGVLDEAPNEVGESAAAGQPNLYAWHEGDGVRFIAALSPLDYADWGGREGQDLGFTAYLGAAASPDGRYFAFTSERSLTGYENQNAEGELTAEVFLYDSVSDEVSCVSCNPTGAAAVGQHLPPAIESNLIPPSDPGRLWAKRWVAAILPEASETQSEGRSLYRSRSVLDNGRVFFNAIDPLVPGDSNGRWDVYQYEPVGVGSCTSSSEAAAVALSGDACVSLVSSGTAGGDSSFFDASTSGDDVFFLTDGRLSVLDSDEAPDVYDARVDGIPAVIPSTPGCVGEACQPAIGPPDDPTPASEGFRGPENVIRCARGKRKVHRHGKVRCVRKSHKHKRHHRKAAGKHGRAH